MPMYEYKCQRCGIRFERIQHFKDEPLKVCPECGGHLNRLIQPVGIIFKGSGFYITDNRQLPSGSGRPHKKLAAAKEPDDKKPLPAAESSEPKKTEATG